MSQVYSSISEMLVKLFSVLIALLACGLCVAMLAHTTTVSTKINKDVLVPHTQQQSGWSQRGQISLWRKENKTLELESEMFGWPWPYLTATKELAMPWPVLADSDSNLTRFTDFSINWLQLFKVLAIPLSLVIYAIVLLRFFQRKSDQYAPTTNIRFGLRTLLISTFVIAAIIATSCWLINRTHQWRLRHTIWHTGTASTIVLPTGEEFQANRWYGRTDALERLGVLRLASSLDKRFLVDEPSFPIWANAPGPGPIAVVAVDGEYYEAVIEQYAHYGSGYHEYWVIPGDRISPDQSAVR